MNKIPEISAFFLAYNEEGNIKKLIEQADITLKQLSDKYEIIIILFKGSTDNTESIINELKTKYSNLSLIHQEIGDKGYGKALKIGINNSKYQYIFYSDADLQFNIEEIKQFLPYINDYQILTGYRKNRQDPFTRKIIAKVYNIIISNVFKFKVKDIDCAFKIFNKDIFNNITLESKTGMTIPEIYAKAVRNNFKIKELPVTHYKRPSGSSIFESKFALVKFSVIKNIVKEMIKLKKQLK